MDGSALRLASRSENPLGATLAQGRRSTHADRARTKLLLARRSCTPEWRTANLGARILLLVVVAVTLLLTGLRCAQASIGQPGFPRLAILRPAPGSQLDADTERYDWAELQIGGAQDIAALRALNPNIVLLAPTNARELDYVLGPDEYDNPANVELRSASTDWMLTQVGSSLTADISASATSIPVADVTKFAKNEMVLVDHELMYVTGIDHSSLIVMARGPVDPPASHLAGARIAAVVSSWPGSITMDLSTGCPLRDVGDGNGPETWSDWNVQRGLRTLSSADWDGLVIDCLEPDVAWMVTTHNVRSIDPTRSNTYVTDNYAAFDASWSAGALVYDAAMRRACGDKLLVGNGNLKDYTFNGTVFETFPSPGISLKNWDFVFVGPWDTPHASYPDWCANAASPNLTLIQTYGARTDYRLMRFGLCSALMSDGYFSYAPSSGDQVVSSLDWFDEYDGGGIGRGYLGQPVTSAVKVGNTWRRDFTNGVSLVNPSGSAVTVKLGGTFRKIKGAQDPVVNDGSLVTSVKLAAQDGVVLLRIPDLQASRSSVAYGAETTLTVKLPPISAQEVRFEQRAAGSSAWRRVTTMTVDASGTAQLARSPLSTTEYRAVLAGSDVVSRTVKVGVLPAVTIHVSRTSARRGSAVTIGGAIAHFGRVTVTVQRRSAGRWKTVKRFVTSAAGSYSTRVSMSTRGTFAYRVYVAAATSHLAAASGIVRITFR